MELLEKYLQAVKFWLPSSQQHDIVAELRDDIRSEAEERESVLGRTLNESEWEALLKERGRPLLVAEKYLPQRSLIGPVLFPAYWFVLRLALLCYFLPCIGVWLALILCRPEYRAQHLGWAALGDAYFLVSHALAAAAIVTLVFATLERVKDKGWLTNDWSPRKLPRVRDTQRISRASSGTELVFGVIFGLWWLKILWTSVLFDAGSIRVMISPAWHRFFWAFLLLWIGSSAFSALNFVRPYWTRVRHGLRAALNIASGVVLFLLTKTSLTMLVEGPAIPRGTAHDISWSVTFGLSFAFAIAALVCWITAVVEIWRAIRKDNATRPLDHLVTT